MTEIIRYALDKNEISEPNTLLRFSQLPALGALQLNRYPDDDATELKRLLSRHCGAGSEHITIGNGAAEILDMALAALGRPGDKVLIVKPTFPLFKDLIHFHHKCMVEVDLTRDLSLSGEDLVAAIGREDPAIVLLASPGNPSGQPVPPDMMRWLLCDRNRIVILDEAYIEHSRVESFASRIDAHENLLVVRSLSKLGLAGLRLGYGVAGSRITAQLAGSGRKFRVGTVSQHIAATFLKRRDLIEALCASARIERDRVKSGFNSIERLTVLDSQANFNVIGLPDASDLMRELDALGMDVLRFHHLGMQFMRISAAPPDVGKALVAAVISMMSIPEDDVGRRLQDLERL